MHPYRDQARSSTTSSIKRASKGSFSGRDANPITPQESDTPPDDGAIWPASAQRGKKRTKLATGGTAMLEGDAAKKNLGRKGRGSGTNVNIIIADKPDAPAAPALPIKPPMAMAPPPMRPPVAPPMQPPGMPPGAPPTGLPPQLAAAALAARANGQPPMKRGGSTIPKMTAGADSGPGRLEEAKAARSGR